MKPNGRRAVVLGAGGAGFCAARALLRAGAETIIVNRSAARARRVAAFLGCESRRMVELRHLLEKADLLVSCLPAGVVPLRPQWLGPRLVVLDPEYASGALAASARKRGCRVIDGGSWLVFQAAAGFRFMCGRPPPRTSVLLRALREGRRPGPNLALIGLSGSGKTTLGRWLAGELGLDFCDLDAEIERRCGMQVSDIFARLGEEAFRRMERAALADVLRRDRTVIACGGGAVLDRLNRNRLRKCCWVVWLWAEPEDCARRLPAGSRPLLRMSDPARGLARQFRARRLHYAACASLVVDTAGDSVRQVGRRIAYEESFRPRG